MKPIAFLAGAALGLVAPFAFAQATPPAETPTHTCAKPDYPGKLASSNQMKGFDKKAKEYGECMKAYVEARNVAIRTNEVKGKAAMDEYHGWLAAVRAESGQDKDGPDLTAPNTSGAKKY